ncbi:MAG TPA: signal peptidase II [Coriobacteriia bacterium]|nr:signal peptidase II [Coriobacteriia bacterium]
MQVSRRAALSIAHPARTFWLIAIATFLVDQVSKSVVRVLWNATEPMDAITLRFLSPTFSAQHSVPLLGDVLTLTHVRNAGAAFGMFPGYQPVFMLTSTVVLVVVAGYWLRAKPTEWPLVIALALVAGGASGNLVDRAVVGRVTDFIYAAIIDFPVFNLADSAIFIGVGILIWWLLFGPIPQVEEREEERAALDAAEATDTSEGVGA